jgi:hypothetical protein
MQQALCPLHRIAVEVASEDRHGLRAFVMCQHSVPQSLEDRLSSVFIFPAQLRFFAGWAVVVEYVQWWLTL